MKKTRGPQEVAQSATEVKSVSEMRPPACPRCGQASRPEGGKLGLHGHGTRQRQVRGPRGDGAASMVAEVVVRRFRCARRSCRATVTVAPPRVVRRRLYLASAMAFVLLGVRRLPQRAVRARLCALKTWGEGSATRWDALADWLAAVRDGRLFRCVRHPPDDWPPWRVAERAGATLAALGPPGAALESAAFEGSARAA